MKSIFLHAFLIQKWKICAHTTALRAMAAHAMPFPHHLCLTNNTPRCLVPTMFLHSIWISYPRTKIFSFYHEHIVWSHVHTAAQSRAGQQGRLLRTTFSQAWNVCQDSSCATLGSSFQYLTIFIVKVKEN